MVYKFNQFNAEIVDPVVVVNKQTIKINYIAKTATADVTLTDPSGSKFGVLLEDMPFDNVDLNLVDIDNMVSIKLQEFEMNS